MPRTWSPCSVVFRKTAIMRNEGMNVMRKTLLVALAGIAGFAVSAALVERARARSGERRSTKDDVLVWENEGGNVPDVPTVRPRPISSRRHAGS